MEFRLPELGEGIEVATVSDVLVQPGSQVQPGQDVLQVETDKASMPVPIDQAGKVQEIRVKPGDNIQVGSVIMVLKAAEGAGAAPPTPAKPPEEISQPMATPPPPVAATPSGGGQKHSFVLPDLGEGIENATVVRIAVTEGASFQKDATLLEVETDKAAMPIPAPAAGIVEEIYVQQGQTIQVGELVMELHLQEATSPASKSSPAKPPAVTAAVPASNGQRSAPTTPSSAPTPRSPNGATHDRHVPVPASPSTRRLARELNVDLYQVPGSARGNRVTVEDVQAFVRHRMSQPAGSGGVSVGQPELPDFSKHGPIERQPVSRIRKTIAQNMAVTWTTCPMVTQFDHADITELEAGRKRTMEKLPKGSPKITMTVLAIKAVVAALREFPHFNASFDMAAGELILKHHYHMGIAVDTERGLVVPVIRDADQKTITALAAEVTEIATRARDGKLSLEEMRGGTFTITNLGGIGGTAFSPIINYPEVAILGMARSSLQPVVYEGQIQPRLMLPLCLTYDHRIIDGADGARFTSRLAQMLSDPVQLLLGS